MRGPGGGDRQLAAQRAGCGGHAGRGAGRAEGQSGMSEGLQANPIRLRLPASSANLGSGFDAAAVALDFYLEIEAATAKEYSIVATGRDRERCSRQIGRASVGKECRSR